MKPCSKCWGTGREINSRLIGWRMRRVRQKKGILLKRAAQAVGVSECFMSLLENGKRLWTRQMYRRTINYYAHRKDRA